MRVVEESEPIRLEADFLCRFQQQVLSWQEPFILHITTMAGAEAFVQVDRRTTVAAVRERASKELEVKEYRLTLASTESNHKLEPPSATLEELGLCCDQCLVAFLGQVDRWQELSIPEFLELATSLGVLEAHDAAQQQQKFESGKSKREDVQTQALCARIERKEEALHREEEDRRRKAEEQRLRREQVKKDLLAAAATATTVREGCEQKAAEVRACLERLCQEVSLIKCDVEADLSEVLPALDAANDMLNRLRKVDVQELRCLSSPPVAVKLTMQALCLLFQVRPVRVRDESSRFREDYWPVAVHHLLCNQKLLQEMLCFDKDHIPAVVIKRLSHLLENDDLEPERVRKCSTFCHAACVWVRSVFKYHFVAMATEPKVAYLRGKEQELEQCQLEEDILVELLNEVEPRV